MSRAVAEGQESEAPQRLWTRTTWPFIAATLALMTFIAFESLAVTTVLPVAMRELHGERWYSLAYAASITTGLVGVLVGGRWADRDGAYRPLVVGGGTFLLGIALCAFTPNAAVFVLGRLLQGIGGGIDSVVLYVLIARHIPEAVRPKMFGLLTTAWLLPSIAGPLAAGLLTELLDWRASFTIILAGAAVSLLALLVVARGGDGPRPDTGGALFGRHGLLAVAAAGVLLVLHLGGQWAPPRSAIVVPLGLVALGVVAAALLPAGTLRLRAGAPRLVALRAMLGATVTASDVYLTLYLQQQRGFTPTGAGLVVAIGTVGWVAGAWWQGRAGDGVAEHRRVLGISGPLVLAGSSAVLLYTVGLVPVWLVVAACVLMGAGMGMAYPRVSAATLAIAAQREHGRYSSALQSGESMSSAGLLAVTGALLTAVPGGSGFVPAYALVVALGLLAAVVANRDPAGNPRQGM